MNAWISCSDCQFWDLKEVNKGICRIDPPIVEVFLTQGGPLLVSVQPEINRDCGCSRGQIKPAVLSS